MAFYANKYVAILRKRFVHLFHINWWTVEDNFGSAVFIRRTFYQTIYTY